MAIIIPLRVIFLHFLTPERYL